MKESPTPETPAVARHSSGKIRRRWLIGGMAVLASLMAFAAFSSGLGHKTGELMADGYNEARVALLLDHMLADASEAQKDEVGAIVKGTVSEVKALRAMNKTNRHDVLRLLTQPTVDRAALESLRAQQMVTIDEASRLVADGLADAAEVLTTAQRVALATKLEARWK